MAATTGLRHAVLWVSDPVVSGDFYADVLGMNKKAASENAVFLSSPSSNTDHDLGLFRVEPGRALTNRVGLYHLAWEVPTLQDLADTKQRLMDLGAYVGENNHGATRSLYAHDPDGLEFEVLWELEPGVIAEDEASNVPLDFEADFERFGADAKSRGA
jgi:catechol-2,3-dioxygenase